MPELEHHDIETNSIRLHVVQGQKAVHLSSYYMVFLSFGMVGGIRSLIWLLLATAFGCLISEATT